MSDAGHLPSATFGDQQQPGRADGDPSETAPRRPNAGLASAFIIAVVLSIMTAAAVVGRPDSGLSASAALAYLPPSGTRVLLQGSDGSDTVDEYFTTVGLPALQSGPAALGYASTDVDEFRRTTWVRVATLTAGSEARVSDRYTQLFAALPGGLELRVAAWPQSFLAFRPGLLVLPADVQPGKSWTVAGTALVGGVTELTGSEPFSAQFSATAGDPGCVVVASTLSVGAGNDPTISSGTTTWCTGRGVTAGTEDARSTSAVERAPVWQKLGRAAAPEPSTPSGPGTLTRQDMTGLAPMALSPRIPPVILPGPVLVYANNLGADLVARGWTDGRANARWAAHPGGEVTGLVAAGSVVVAATTERRVVAYGEQGEFLWQADVGDVSQATMVRLGPQVVVATLDGGVTGFDAESGAVLWEHRMPNEVRRPLVALDAGVTVMDQAGNLQTFAADGTVVHQLELDAPESFTVNGAVAIVAARADGLVRGYRLSDGELLWRTPVAGARPALHPVGEQVVVQQLDDILALRVADGAPVWSRPIIVSAAAPVTGGRLLVSDRTTLHLFDSSGTVLASWPTSETDLDSGNQTAIVTGAGESILIFSEIAYRWRPA